jgi:hypothetical protein
MAAGANQQLIISKLEPPPPPLEEPKPVKPDEPPPAAPPSDTLNISHDETGKDSGEVEVKPGEIHIDKYGNIVNPDDISAAAQGLRAEAKPPSSDMPSVLPSPPASAEAPEPIAETAPEPEPEPMPQELPKPEPIAAEPKPEPVPQELPKPMPPEPQPAPAAPEPAHEESKKAAGSHSMISKSAAPPVMSSASGPDGGKDELEDEKNRPIDLMSDTGLSSETSVYPEPEPAPAPTFPLPTVDAARNAVQNAQASGAYQPHAKNPEQEEEATEDDLAKPAPPPVPPPLPQATTEAAAAKTTAGRATELAKPL